jgi:uncharacterized membrane protein required for colicin V production
MSTLPFNLFDILLVVVMAAGVVRGRRIGISQELPGMIKWVCLMLVCAIVYKPAGLLVSAFGEFDLLPCYLSAYLGLALLMFLLFSILERRLLPRLMENDFFGRGEYFLGMGCGQLRSTSMLLVALALLNAREFSPLEVRAMERYQEENFGSEVFPGLHTLQAAVFESSFTGSFIKDHLGFLLITPTQADQKQPDSDSPKPAPKR